MELTALDPPEIVTPAEPRPRWDEKKMQEAVYVHCAIKNHVMVVPNSCVFGWESDVVSVNKSGFVSEFEIKVTRADFKADAKKSRAKLLVEPLQKSTFRDYLHPRPNYFFYAVPAGLVGPEEVPEYAGLLYVCKEPFAHYGRPALMYGTVEEVKPARRLHREKVTPGQRSQMARSIAERYWRERFRRLSAE